MLKETRQKKIETDTALQHAYKKREEAYRYSDKLQDEVIIEHARREKWLTAKAAIHLMLVSVLLLIVLGLYIHAYS